MAVRFFPLAVDAVAGGLDGVLRDSDVKNSRTGIKRWSTLYKAALVVGGYLAETTGFSRDISEPMVYGGLFGLASEGGAYLARNTIGGYAAPQVLATPAAAALSGVGRSAAQIVSPQNRKQPAGVLV